MHAKRNRRQKCAGQTSQPPISGRAGKAPPASDAVVERIMIDLCSVLDRFDAGNLAQDAAIHIQWALDLLEANRRTVTTHRIDPDAF